jgi:tryptophan halogenase
MKIVIIGGGTAGWITTFYLSSIKNGNQYVNISSEEIPIIGVGEGTTGRFPDVFSKGIYGININEMMYEIKGLPKLGIKLRNWSKSTYEFYSPIDGTYTQDFYIDYSTYSSYYNQSDLLSCSQFSFLMENQKTNFKKIDNSDGSVSIDYNIDGHAMHIDAYKTSEYFKTKSLFNGVKYIDSTVKQVKTDQNKITSIILSDGTEVTADLFIDCSGFSRVLSKELEGTGWEDYSKYLPVNKALVYSFDEDEITSIRKEYTLAEAMNNGWLWEIPTRDKVGRGYVYCDTFATEDEIVNELVQKYNRSINKVRTISFSSGRLKKFLNGNCVSIGLSSAFLEPLQATSIHCALVQLELFVYNFISDIKLLDDQTVVESYNKKVAQLYDEMRDFVALHYTGGKTNSDFWKYCLTMERPERVNQLLHLSKSRLMRSFDFERMVGSVNQESWNPILSGLGHFNRRTIRDVFESDHASLEWWKSQIEKFEKETVSTYQNNLSSEELNNLFLSLGKT